MFGQKRRTKSKKGLPRFFTNTWGIGGGRSGCKWGGGKKEKKLNTNREEENRTRR